MVLETSGLVSIKQNKLLLVYSNNKKAWYLPGGKTAKGEDAEQTLIREVREELSVIMQPDKLTYLFHITAQAYGEPLGVIMEQECFLYDLTENITIDNEIGGAKYFSYEAYLQEPICVEGVIKVFNNLFDRELMYHNTSL